MSADKIVNVVRMLEECTAMLESLQNEIHESKEYAKRLESQLATSQARERAAVEDCKGYCATCAFLRDCAKHDNNCTSDTAWYYGDCEDWQWRGSQTEKVKQDEH